MDQPGQVEQVEQLLDSPELAEALENDQFKLFLDQLPVAIAVSSLRGTEAVVYCNRAFERLSGRASAQIVGHPWESLPGTRSGSEAFVPLGDAVVEGGDFIGTFVIERENETPHVVDAWSSVIENDEGVPVFRLVALICSGVREETEHELLVRRIQDKDVLLRELQHRVRNNLQMVTALIRMEARHADDASGSAGFDRLAGRVESLALLYRALEAGQEPQGEEVDLGVYLSQIAAAVTQAHAVEGIRLDLKVDTWPVSINVAMPAGLVVNELLTNALKHAFEGREGGTIKLHSLIDERSCRVIIADDGVGLPADVEWPVRGKLSSLIVKSLRENAKAKIEVQSSPGEGMQVTITFTRASATENG